MEPEPVNEPIVERPEDDDLPIRLGVDVPDDDVAPDEDAEPDGEPAPVPMLRSVVGRGVVHEDFSDGLYSGLQTTMRVKPRIMTEGGRTFLRITGSPGDTASIPARFTERTRSTITLTSHYNAMPLILPSNERQTYRADLRVSPPCPHGAAVMELFQGAPGGESAYGAQNGTGPSARFCVTKGRANFETRYNNEHKVDRYDLGVAGNAWHTYELVAVWSHDPRVGRFDVSVDGKHKYTIRGRDVNLGPLTNRLPMVKFGLYGDEVTGTCDIANIHLYPTGGYVPGVPTPPTPIPEPPTERRTGAANCGGQAYTATDGTVYATDRAYQGGRKETTTTLVSGTEDVPLYQSWRYGNSRYQAPCANGNYRLTLHFAEHLHTEPGQRLFDVLVEGEPVLTRLDVCAKVGAKAAYVVEIPVTVTDGALTVSFASLVGNAMISAIKVEPI